MTMMLTTENAKFIEELYEKYLKNKSELSPEWRSYFDELESSNHSSNGAGMTFQNLASKNAHIPLPQNPFLFQQNKNLVETTKNIAVQELILAYRRFGMLSAKIDPLDMTNYTSLNRDILDLTHYALEPSDLERTFQTDIEGMEKAKLKDIISKLEHCYCNTTGADYTYIRNIQERTWFQRELESLKYSADLGTEEQLNIFKKLYEAESFEKFLAQRFVGKKRFSLEGSETFIPMMDTLIESAALHNINTIAIGMAHRGRLNLLVNILQKPASFIFAEFEEKFAQEPYDYADVKYHLGYSYDYTTRSNKKIHLTLAFNPSHLEAVNPVAVGNIRARQTKNKDVDRKYYMPVLIHGDAAFMGQGVVSETLNLCNLNGYTVGGTIHIIINNQIGFTTLPHDSRSTEYATDIAKAFQIPILHVNGDDPEACYRVMKLAMEYRQKFSKDIVIDLVSYRRLGHNETDEPAFTQPLMYEKIRSLPTTFSFYKQKLLEEKKISNKNLEAIEKTINEALESSYQESQKSMNAVRVDTMKGAWATYTMYLNEEDTKHDTQLFVDQLDKLVNALTQVPKDFNINPKLAKLLESRKKMAKGEMPLDWGFAEALAFGSILSHKTNIRLSGQDAKRGTFSHRHSVLNDIKNGKEYVLLNHISNDQGFFEVCNSPLSEFSVLGFEYGYSLADPDVFIIWEAQFGDFANGAQIIIDQFISCSEVKWYRMSGLVMLLPHGYEGQGPEHSSARIERFLQLCANNNMQVCNCSNAAQYFHLLRRQALRRTRKPLIIMTPKSLLRMDIAGCDIKDISQGSFQELLYNKKDPKLATAKRIVFCSGKVYYDAEAERQLQKKDEIFIVRMEQLYPLPLSSIKELIKNAKKAEEYYWLQEEPINQGAWSFISNHLQNLLPPNSKLKCVARPESSSPAAGLYKLHVSEQKKLVTDVLS